MFLVNPYAHGNVFSPSDISGLVGWWDAEDSDTITESSGEISAWANKSGATGDLVQTTAGLKPNNQDVGGLNMIHFDGGDRLGLSDDDDLDFATDFSIAIVFQTTDANRGLLVGKGTAATYAKRYFIRVNNADTNNGDIVFDTDDDSAPATLASDDEEFNDGATRLVFFTRDGTDLEGYSNNVELTQSPVDVTGQGSLANDGAFTVGQLAGSGHELTGEIAEIVIYSKALTADERLLLSEYLADKWGITLP